MVALLLLVVLTVADMAAKVTTAKRGPVAAEEPIWQQRGGITCVEHVCMLLYMIARREIHTGGREKRKFPSLAPEASRSGLAVPEAGGADVAQLEAPAAQVLAVVVEVVLGAVAGDVDVGIVRRRRSYRWRRYRFR